MSSNVTEKYTRANRRNRSEKPDPEQGSSNNNTDNAVERTPLSKSIMEFGIKPLNCFMSSHDSAPNTNPIPTPGAGFDEEQLEGVLMKELELLYDEAIVKLVSLGYDEGVALKAILKNGFCYGGMDVLNNILHNAISYLKSGKSSEESAANNFTDLRQMQKYSLAGMVCLLQQVKPQFSKADAMWCLIMSDLNVGRASVMDIPVLPAPLQREVECPKRFNLSPSMKSLLKKNIATFDDAGFMSNSKGIQSQSQPASGLLPSGYSESQNTKNQDVVNYLLSKFHDLSLDESTENGHPQMDKEDEIIVNLIHQIKGLERQRKEREEWAHQKAIQALRKLSNDIIELEMLRMEREETQSVKKGKQIIEDSIMKKLTELENALRKATGELDRANSAVKKLETENAEISAEIEACKMSASESATTFMEAVKREKKYLKKISALEKQKSKLQEDIAAQKQKYSDLAEQLAQAEADQKKAEEKWCEEQAAKVVAHGDVARLLHGLDDPENSAEKEVECDRECILCNKDEVSVLFLPCAHLVVCANCNNGKAACPRCLVPIEQRIRVFGI